MRGVATLETTEQDDYDFLTKILHKVRIRERGYTEHEAIQTDY
jgi:hypothetical protein